MGVFSTAFKSAVVKRQLKRNDLYSFIPNNHRAVSNLPFLKKVVEKLVLNHLNNLFDSHNIFEKTSVWLQDQ